MSVPSVTQPNAVHPAPFRKKISLGTLWYGLWAAPAAWSVQTLVNLPVSSHFCFPRLEPLSAPETGVRGMAFVVSVAALFVCLSALTVATRTWLRTREEHHGASGKGRAHVPTTALLETGEGRTRFMALCGTLTSATFFIASVAHTAAIFLVLPCAS
jgi:hypothetical protein